MHAVIYRTGARLVFIKLVRKTLVITCHQFKTVYSFKETSATANAAFESEADLDIYTSIKFSVVRKLRLALMKCTSAEGT